MKGLPLTLVGLLALGASPSSAMSEIVLADYSIADIQTSVRAACPVEADLASRTAMIVTESQPIPNTVVMDMSGIIDFEGGVGVRASTDDTIVRYQMDSELDRDISIARTALSYHFASATGLSVAFYSALDDLEPVPAGTVEQARAHLDIVKCLSTSDLIGADHWMTIAHSDCFLEMFDGWVSILEEDDLHLRMADTSFDWDAARQSFLAHIEHIDAKYPTCSSSRS